jgi:predicted SAM-dependent methyltransferase
LQQALDFIDAYDNFVRPHGALRVAMPEGASPRRWRHRTPTMTASFTDHPWTLEELLWYM